VAGIERPESPAMTPLQIAIFAYLVALLVAQRMSDTTLHFVPKWLWALSQFLTVTLALVEYYPKSVAMRRNYWIVTFGLVVPLTLWILWSGLSK
jgi:hypothetical protein